MTGTRVQFHFAQYQWWGVPSRYVQLVDHLDPLCHTITTRGTSDMVDLAAMPDWQRRTAELIRPEFARHHRAWHNLNDLASEVATLELCCDGKVDIVHFLDGEHSGPILPQVMRNRLPGVRTVASFHQPPDLAEKVLFGPDLRQIDAIILMSPSQVPFFAQFVPNERLHVILHGVDTDFFTPPAVKRPRDRLHCITTGLHLRDWDAFHAVAMALPEVAFTVVTSGRVKISPLPNVEVLSGISDADLAAAYRAADVLFLPLTDATANNSILEGMASGLPVISTDLPAVRAYVPDAAGILIEANAVPDLVSALNRLAGDHALRARMASAARSRAEALAWSNVARQYEAVYSKLMAEPVPMAKPLVAAVPDLPPISGPKTARGAVWAATPLADVTAFASLSAWSDRLRREGLEAEAGMVVDALAASHPGLAATREALARAAAAEWRWFEAADQWDQFLRLCPEDRRGEVLAELAFAQAQTGAIVLAQATLAKGKGCFEALLATARLAEDFATPDQALAAWTDCSEQYPDRIDAFLGLAAHHLRQAQFDAAEELLDHLRRVWPDAAKVAALWARSADEAGLSRRIAAQRWDRVLTLHGSAPSVLLSCARHLGLSADLVACKALLAHVATDPCQQTEILLRYHIAGGDFVQAADQARQAVALRPADLAKRLRLADVLLRLGTQPAQAEALAILQYLQDHAPEAAILRASLAIALIATGDEGAAHSAIDALPEERTDAQAGLLRLWARVRSERDAAAQTHLRTLIVGFGYTMPDLC